MAVKAKQFAYGDWNDLLNPDYLSKMVLSLPGMAYYDAIMPWVYKQRPHKNVMNDTSVYCNDGLHDRPMC